MTATECCGLAADHVGGASTTAVVLADRQGIIRSWDAGAERLFGHPPATALGQSLDLLVPEAFRERHWAGFRRAMRTGECRLDGAATNMPVKLASGTTGVFPARFVFLTDAHGHAAGAVGIYGAPSGGERPFTPVSQVGDGASASGASAAEWRLRARCSG